MRKPNFEKNIGAVLRKEIPQNPTLFEFLLSGEAVNALAGPADHSKKNAYIRQNIKAFYNGGYDCVPIYAGGFGFKRGERHGKESISINDGALITDWESFEKYKWNEPEDYSYDWLDEMGAELPDGMKFMVFSADGVLENVIGLTGYENLCYMLADERDLAREIFKNVGERLIRYHKLCAQHKSVGILMSNDDWGFKSGTMISHNDMREFVYPYHKGIVNAAREKGIYCVMHSCGNFDGIYEELYNVIGFDGKHSNEDVIKPVEKAYKESVGKIAVLGGIDVDFLTRATVTEIEERCKKMLKLAEKQGGYALGSGNSIPPYIPVKNYLTMVRAANPEVVLA